MPKPPRILLPKTLVFITSRVQQGLPFVHHPTMSKSLWGIIARAQTLYNVEICALMFMGNHFHILAVVKDQSAIPAFMRRIKTESAHMVNKYLDRRQCSVWCDGYDCVPLLTFEDAIDKFVYLYTNPTRARISKTINNYQGVNTWEMFISSHNEKSCYWRGRISSKSSEQKNENLHKFTLSPYNWAKTVFKMELENDEIKNQIVDLVTAFEKSLETKASLIQREQNLKLDIKKTIKALQNFKPKKFGRRMWCICSDLNRKMMFLHYIKCLKDTAKKVYERWKLGDFSPQYPIELFAPKYPKILNPVFTF
jgi:REP element-mobilizing transposase RayT